MSKQVSFMGIKSSWSVQQTEHFNSSAQHFQEESDYPSRKDFAVPKSHHPICFSGSVLKKNSRRTWELSKHFFICSESFLSCLLFITPLANRLVTPVGAMRSFKLNVWMMTLSKLSFSECWGILCQLLSQQLQPGSGLNIYVLSHGGHAC